MFFRCFTLCGDAGDGDLRFGSFLVVSPPLGGLDVDHLAVVHIGGPLEAVEDEFAIVVEVTFDGTRRFGLLGEFLLFYFTVS